MLSIGEFSEMCHLSPQTLRFYHSEGLLVPADVNERTGYRGYTFGQVEQAMLVTVLRGTGMSVKTVRLALDERDTAPGLLRQHSEEVQRQRRIQDEAISDARQFLESWPEARLRHVPETTVVSKLVAPPLSGLDHYDWDEADAASSSAIRDLAKVAESCGAVVSGTPWRTWAIETPEQKRQGMTSDGPHWLVKIPVEADGKAVAALSGSVDVQAFEAREELAIFMPGKSSMAKFGTALTHLTTYPLEDAYVDLASMRQLLLDDGVETSVAIRKMEDEDGGLA